MPNVFGHCAAGCDYPVPTKEEFDAYAKVTSRFPEPTLNTAKQLTEGSGYYYLKTDHYSSGIFYWEEGKIVKLPAQVYLGEGAVSCEIYYALVGANGTLKYYAGGYPSNEEGWILQEDLTSSTKFYTAKIVDTELPDIAEGESY